MGVSEEDRKDIKNIWSNNGRKYPQNYRTLIDISKRTRNSK
jgi:hypothetical protein